MNTSSNVRALRTVPSASPDPCSMCGSRTDVVLCSFAFERVHRRVPLCRQHRQPFVEIDHFTRPVAAAPYDVPPSWSERPMPRRPSRRLPRRSRDGVLAGTVVLLPVR